jgi:phosphatidate phosphatase APP1
MSRIITSHDFPPIPVRYLDWSACYDGFEEDGPYGHGATEAEAIADLLENTEDEA